VAQQAHLIQTFHHIRHRRAGHTKLVGEQLRGRGLAIHLQPVRCLEVVLHGMADLRRGRRLSLVRSPIFGCDHVDSSLQAPQQRQYPEMLGLWTNDVKVRGIPLVFSPMD